MGTHVTDDELMLRVQNGDMEAFAILAKTYQPNLVWFVKRRLKDSHIAEDLAQETLLRLFASCRSYQPRGSLIAWIYRIARNVITDYVRRSKHDTLKEAGQSDEIENVIDRCADDMPLPEDVCDNSELLGIVDDALATIPDDQRLTFVLHVYTGLSLPEIALMRDMPLPTVKSQLRLARIKLRHKLSIDYPATEWESRDPIGMRSRCQQYETIGV